MRLSTFVTFIAASCLAAAQTLTGAGDCTAAGKFTLCQNLWGASYGAGNQNTTLLSDEGSTVAWRTQWQWQNNDTDVKSYANVISNTAKGVKLSALTSAPTNWTWIYESASSGIRADVSYDIWTGTAQSGDPASSASSFEIMIWLSSKGGIQPIGSKVASGISLVGYSWTLWKGPNKNWEVLSFVTEDGDLTKFTADLKEFFDYVVDNQNVSSSQYVQAIQAGTEPFTGSASLLTRSYKVTLNQ